MVRPVPGLLARGGCYWGQRQWCLSRSSHQISGRRWWHRWAPQRSGFVSCRWPYIAYLDYSPLNPKEFSACFPVLTLWSPTRYPDYSELWHSWSPRYCFMSWPGRPKCNSCLVFSGQEYECLSFQSFSCLSWPTVQIELEPAGFSCSSFGNS